MSADTPPPVDIDEPPPRKRGLGRGLAELEAAGYALDDQGRPYTSLDCLMWALAKGDEKRAAERTPQPKVLGRLPDPVTTGPLQLADIVAAQERREAPRRLSESAAILNRALEHPGEAIRVEPLERVAPEPVQAPAPRRGLDLSSLDELEF